MQIKTIQEVASLGGKARAKALSPERRKEIAANAGRAKGKKLDKSAIHKRNV